MMRHWHEAYAFTIDEMQDSLKRAFDNPGGIEVVLPTGEKTLVKISKEDADEITKLWSGPRKEELKGVWNLNNYALAEYKRDSAILIRTGMVPYENMVPWSNFSDAMNWLAHHELEIKRAQKEAEEQNDGEE